MRPATDRVEVPSIEALVDALERHDAVRFGIGRHAPFALLGGAVELEVALPEHLDLEPADLVVTASAQTNLYGLQNRLAEHRLCLPHGGLFANPDPVSAACLGALDEAIYFSLPHPLEAQFGSWRDWILGATVILADGTVAKSGSRVVKSVAGYDVHKVLVGSRGAFAVLLDVTLRLQPLDYVASRVRPRGGSSWDTEKPLWVQRTLPTNFPAALSAAEPWLIDHDRPSNTLYAALPSEAELPRFAHDWVLRANCGEANLQIADPDYLRLSRRAKDVFDPKRKLNPGALGVV